MKKRILKTAAVYALVFGVLLAYYVFVRVTGIGIPCLIKKLTSHNCPGCGNSRAFMALARLDIKAAAGYNLFFFAELLYIAYACVYISIGYIRSGRYQAVVKPAAVNVAFLAMLAVWWAVRNILGI